MISSILALLRSEYHKKICINLLGHRPGKKDVYSNADDSSIVSIELARGLADRLGGPFCTNPPSAQGACELFIQLTKEFLSTTLGLLQHLRPGEWRFLASKGSGDYLITPDIVVSRDPLSDGEINAGSKGKDAIVSDRDKTSGFTPLRKQNFPADYQLLHASISCKWTMRSDRAQNTRTEALNLIRNRKGRVPNIVAVTFEPLPARLASLALGTGDIDCTYHGALHELIDAAKNSSYQDAFELLTLMVDGRRLRDISDLPFDLAI
ncbi:MAG: restriction endonuclease [Nitrospiraceae bacterium]|nr:MAG: restriction endonuclease [Nitrospiraceae bacterium]